MAQAKLLQAQAYERLRRRLLRGNLETGGRLSHRNLAKKLNASLGSIRVALDRLEGEGLVECLPQSGVRVRQVNNWEWHELHDLRSLVECYAARRAARWITRAQIERLYKACADSELAVAACEESADPTIPERIVQKAFRADIDFHGTILRAARNASALRIVESFHLITKVASQVPSLPRVVRLRVWRRVPAQHRAIADALAAGDAKKAERLMREHMELGRDPDIFGRPPEGSNECR